MRKYPPFKASPIAAAMQAINPTRPFKKQRGFSLLDVTLALAISAAVVAVAARGQLRQHEDSMAQAEANQLATIANGLQDYLDRYKDIIVKQTAAIPYPDGVRDEYDQTQLPAGTLAGSTGHPSINQLKLLGLLPSDFNPQSMVSQNSYALAPIRAMTASNNQVDLTQENHDCLRHVCTLRLMAHTLNPVSGEFGLPVADALTGLWDDRLARLILGKLSDQSSSTGVVGQLNSSAHGSSGAPGESRMFSADGTDMMPNPVVDQPVGIVGAVAQARYQPPLASTDFCPAGWWAFNSSGTSQAITAAQVSSLEATHCVATYGDVSRGLQTTATDYRGSLRGHVQLLCSVNASGQLSLVDVRTSGEAGRLSDSACSAS